MDGSDDPLVTAEEITTMGEEIRRGVPPHESAIEMTAAHRQVWNDLADQAQAEPRGTGWSGD